VPTPAGHFPSCLCGSPAVPPSCHPDRSGGISTRIAARPLICHPDRSGGACPERSPATQDGVERNLNTLRRAPNPHLSSRPQRRDLNTYRRAPAHLSSRPKRRDPLFVASVACCRSPFLSSRGSKATEACPERSRTGTSTPSVTRPSPLESHSPSRNAHLSPPHKDPPPSPPNTDPIHPSLPPSNPPSVAVLGSAGL